MKVSAAGVSSPTGVVKIYAGRKLVGKVLLKAGAGGAARIRIAKLPAGRYKLRATYAGTTGVSSSASKRIVLRVVR